MTMDSIKHSGIFILLKPNRGEHLKTGRSVVNPEKSILVHLPTGPMCGCGLFCHAEMWPVIGTDKLTLDLHGSRAEYHDTLWV